MPGLIYDLMDVLEKESEYYSELLNKSNQKTKIIIDNNIDELKELTSDEQILSAKILKLERQREVVVNDICLVLNISNKNFTITKLIDKLTNSDEEKK